MRQNGSFDAVVFVHGKLRRIALGFFLALMLMALVPPASAVEVCLPAGGSCGADHASNDGLCCSGLVCGPGGLCTAGCRINGTFRSAGEVNPSNVCQACDPSVQTRGWTNVPNGVSCDDGNACTQTDACKKGVCTGSNAVVCVALDECHVPGVCDPATGRCSDPAALDGTTCDAGLAGLEVRACASGACEICCPDPVADPRFVANSDGTVTDRATCRVWEKKVRGSSPEHGVDASVTAVTLLDDILPRINSEAFAGRQDWRVPSLEELSGIRDCSSRAKACVPSIFGTTKSAPYWTSTVSAPGAFWTVHFAETGSAVSTPLNASAYFRVVRGIDHCRDGVQDCGEIFPDVGGSCPSDCPAVFCAGSPSCGDQCLIAATIEGDCFCGFNARCPDEFCSRSEECPAGSRCVPSCGCGGSVCIPQCGSSSTFREMFSVKPRAAGKTS